MVSQLRRTRSKSLFCLQPVLMFLANLTASRSDFICTFSLNSFDVPCGPCQEDPDSPSYPNHGDAYNQKRFPSLAHLTP
jgi:hypothetical protein